MDVIRSESDKKFAQQFLVTILFLITIILIHRSSTKKSHFNPLRPFINYTKTPINPVLKQFLDPYSSDENPNRNRAIEFSKAALEALRNKNIVKPEKKEQSEIVLGIMSAVGLKDRRDGQRNSWLKHGYFNYRFLLDEATDELIW